MRLSVLLAGVLVFGNAMATDPFTGWIVKDPPAAASAEWFCENHGYNKGEWGRAIYWFGPDARSSYKIGEQEVEQSTCWWSPGSC